MYWHIGKRIFEEEQQGKDRAGYGEYLIKYLAEQLQAGFGSGFSRWQLEQFRVFYRLFPIAHTLCAQLAWSYYKLLIRIENQNTREFYIAETTKNHGTVRQLEENKHIVASRYQLYLPTEQQLIAAIEKGMARFQ